MSLLKGAGYGLKGYRWCWKKELRRYVLPSLAINIALMGVLLWLGSLWLAPVTDWIQSWLPAWLLWLQWLFIGVYFIALIWTAFLLLSVLIHWVAMPFNEALSMAVERLLKHENTEIVTEKTMVRQITHSVKEGVERGVYTLKWLVLVGLSVFILSFIPVINLLAPWLLVALGGWLISLEYFDYPLARRGLLFKQQRQLLREQRFSMIGFGAVVAFMLAIPVVNLLVIPAAVIGSTLYCCENRVGLNDAER